MKKILLAVALISFLGLIVVPMALAQAPPTPPTGCTMRHNLTGADWLAAGFDCAGVGAICTFADTSLTCGACCVMDTIYTVTDWIFYIVLAVAVIMVILGGFTIITAGGAAEKVNTGRSYVLYAAIGFLVALLARAIPVLARNILGV